MGCKE